MEKQLPARVMEGMIITGSLVVCADVIVLEGQTLPSVVKETTTVVIQQDNSLSLLFY